MRPSDASIANNDTVQAGNLSIWSSMEMGLGISAGSLATLRPMFRKMLQGAKTIANKSKETLSGQLSLGSSGKHGTVRGTDSRHKSFARRFSLSSKRVTMSTAKRFSDLEAYPSPALPTDHALEKPYEMKDQIKISVNEIPRAKSKPQSPRDRPSLEWMRDDPYPQQPALDGVHQPGASSPYPPRRSSFHSSRYSHSDRSREQTWI